MKLEDGQRARVAMPDEAKMQQKRDCFTITDGGQGIWFVPRDQDETVMVDAVIRTEPIVEPDQGGLFGDAVRGPRPKAQRAAVFVELESGARLELTRAPSSMISEGTLEIL